MKKFYFTKPIFMLLLGIFLSGMALSNDYPKLIPDFKKVTLETGETYNLPDSMLYAENENSEQIRVEISWTIEPDTLGAIASSVFTSEKPGKGYLFATFDTINVAIELEIEDIEEKDYPKVKIVPGNVKVELGDSLELYAFYIDSTDIKTDTTFMWSVSSAELGFFDDAEVPVFKTNMVGMAYIIATLGELTDSVKVEVYEGKWKKDKRKNGKQLTIDPGDSIVTTDAGTIQYYPLFASNSNRNSNEENLEWSVSDTSIATIDNKGLLRLKGIPGLTLVSAKYKNFKASVELLVVDPLADTDINTITMHRVLPNGKELNPKVFKEGESYKISGLPYPLNILNGGMLHFPFGCIAEDITIFMKIPEVYASMDNDSVDVTFNDEIITGVQFDVQPAGSDTIVHPYKFNTPLELKLIFKRELLDSLGIDPLDIDVFFADNAKFNQDGIGMAMVDSAANRIYASIAHFSTIVVRQAEATATFEKQLFQSNNKMNIYPNPLITSSNIQFVLSEAGEVQIEVYNLFGQKVHVLTDRMYDKGIHKIIWAGDDLNGTQAKSGIYFCQYVINGKVEQIRKVIVKR